MYVYAGRKRERDICQRKDAATLLQLDWRREPTTFLGTSIRTIQISTSPGRYLLVISLLHSVRVPPSISFIFQNRLLSGGVVQN